MLEEVPAILCIAWLQHAMFRFEKDVKQKNKHPVIMRCFKCRECKRRNTKDRSFPVLCIISLVTSFFTDTAILQKFVIMVKEC